MNDYRLQFPDEASWWAAADAQGWVAYEYYPQESVAMGEEQAPPVVKNKWLDTNGRDFSVIGTIYKPTGNLLQQGEMQVPEMAAVPGFHVNVRLHHDVLPEALAANRIMPANPVRSFAGGWFEGA
ncbi:MAG: hypothetical protein EBT15_12270 [Betaproteobacteria bacterium]|nr:hypothetical protein [Betaproteobacteria bacterium]